MPQIRNGLAAADQEHAAQPLPPVAPADAQPTDNWFRELKDDRLEVSLRVEAMKMRASGPTADVWRLVERFEELTGVEITGDWRRPPRVGPRALEGQLDLTMQLESGPDDAH